MARKQTANYGQIRRDIMAASATVLARLGYATTTIADLASANGISRGLLYH
ncbi:MAG: TetR family transcriptional regulator [Minwuia sp.]|nr:TetR family transcriptional regulator [Minwuia sp.]